ncbi:MAG TPA: hypothetical protein VHC22_05475 [Pirellulales bacterium]|nr:hypothetical protein [Pirellulales bacterium]
MRGIFCPVLFVVLACQPNAPASAADDAKAVVDKAIQAMGGEAKFGAAKAFTWKTKGTFRFGENESSFTAESTWAGIDKFRQEFSGDFGGNPFKVVVVINGDHGWRTFGDTPMEITGDDLTNEKRTIYLQTIPAGLILPLKSKEFKIELAEAANESDEVATKVTGPDGKDFKLFFSKKTHLPVRAVANVRSFNGEEFTQETTYSEFKDFGGIKKATKHEAKRDGNTFVEAEVTEFKALDQVDPERFAEPK